MKSKRGAWDKIVIDELGKKHTGDNPSKEIILLCALGRLVENKKPFSFNVIVHGSSSAGKDHLIKSVLDLFPKADIEHYGGLSPKALKYMHDVKEDSKFSYDGKILYVEDIEGKSLNDDVMRGFTSGAPKSVIVHEHRAKIKESKGKPVVMTTTASIIPTEEILNRFIIVKVDESEEQTNRIKLFEEEPYSKRIIEQIASLKMLDVEIPVRLMKKIAKAFPSRIRDRRDFIRFLDWIKAVAVFHQRNRASTEDYDIAKDCFMNAYFGVANIPLQIIDKKIVEVLEKAEDPLSISRISDYMGKFIDKRNLYIHLDSLENYGIIEKLAIKEEKFKVMAKYVLSAEMREKNPIKLPNSEEL